MDDIEKQVYRFNWYFAALLIVAALFDIALVWSFARALLYLRTL